MKANLDEKNPLGGVVIGSRIYASNGEFKGGVINKPISKMTIYHDSQKFMSGESSYIYSEKMNQGAFGVSGSYGISGMSLLKSSLSAYVGHSSAVSSESITINYNAVVVGGIEYVNFEDINAGELISSLNKACKDGMEKVLAAYMAVLNAVKESGQDLMSLLYGNDARSEAIKDLISKWVTRSEQFTNEFGDGLVVGIIWGAMCGVKMKITSKSDSTAWKYGAEGDFSYAGPFASCAVKAAYDGSQASSSANISAECSNYVSGNVLSGQADEWLTNVNDMAVKALAEVDAIRLAPSLDKIQAVPPIPEFIQPSVESGISEKMDEIKDLKDLDAMSKASAYDEAKKVNETLSFENFLKKAAEAADKEELDAYRRKMLTNEIDTLQFNNTNKISAEDDFIEKKQSMETADSFLTFQSLALDQSEGTENKSGSAEYAPLGVWIANWSDLFPWLSQACYNSIDGMYGALNVRARVMMQDYQTLSRMYYIACSCGITEFKIKNSSEKITASSIGDAFANAAIKMQEIINKPEEKKIKEIYNDLSTAVQHIYALWNKVVILRGCELGLGLLKDHRSIGAAKPNEDKNSNDIRKVYSLTDCTFEGKDFTVFSDTYKVLPLLTPDGDIWAFGPEMGGLSAAYDTEIVFSKPGRAQYLVFEYNEEEKNLTNKDHGIKLYPIPFSAAKGVKKWKGMSFSTNIGSVQGLHKNLESLSEKLGELKAWSFNSANWPEDWKSDDPYRQSRIRKQYIGIIDEIKNVI